MQNFDTIYFIFKLYCDVIYLQSSHSSPSDLAILFKRIIGVLPMASNELESIEVATVSGGRLQGENIADNTTYYFH